MPVSGELHRLAHRPSAHHLIQIPVVIEVMPAYLQHYLLMTRSPGYQLKLAAELIRRKPSYALLSQLYASQWCPDFAASASPLMVSSRLHPAMQHRMKIHTIPVVLDLDLPCFWSCYLA